MIKLKITELETPCLVVDLDKLEKNIAEMQQLANHHGVKLWPMIKTHKSHYIVDKQIKAGAEGILAAKLSEAEKMLEANVKKIMLAYPIIGEGKLKRLIALSKKAEVYCSIDSLISAEILNKAGIDSQTLFKCIVIIDSGLNRLGIKPEETARFVKSLKELSNLKVVGVATHGGHVYGAVDREGVIEAANQEIMAIEAAEKQLLEEGVACEVVAIGSSPTVKVINNYSSIKQIRPGNYVFNDAVQMALGVAKEDDCSLFVRATVISIPEEGRAIIDAGSKILCLDTGAHGNTSIVGYGRVKGFEEIVVKGLSEELGRLQYNPSKIQLQIGDIIEIIPNHACTVANMVDRIYGVRNRMVEKEILVSARGLVY
ncbi:amino-acid racemase [Alkaliphilus pronyensis]|uniref:Amino-acid racemase n=1 Tax=Alkaliphilus pronyensis TaxID=1482732 RepID=A0A6I0FGX5_9FIRM|nr:alanine racemase [Alkaliphilus pronyensis]KAB3535421.1 amino-acid racemase [Alkaliphilus pronyensis]